MLPAGALLGRNTRRPPALPDHQAIDSRTPPVAATALERFLPAALRRQSGGMGAISAAC